MQWHETWDPLFEHVYAAASHQVVAHAVWQPHDKSSIAHPIPTPVLKLVAELVKPHFTDLFDHWHIAGFKKAFITPIVKKAGPIISDVGSYQSILNLSVVAKLLERIVACQLMAYLSSADLPKLQSGFQPGYSSETAVLQVLSQLIWALNRGDLALWLSSIWWQPLTS